MRCAGSIGSGLSVVPGWLWRWQSSLDCERTGRFRWSMLRGMDFDFSVSAGSGAFVHGALIDRDELFGWVERDPACELVEKAVGDLFRGPDCLPSGGFLSAISGESGGNHSSQQSCCLVGQEFDQHLSLSGRLRSGREDPGNSGWHVVFAGRVGWRAAPELQKRSHQMRVGANCCRDRMSGDWLGVEPFLPDYQRLVSSLVHPLVRWVVPRHRNLF